ncbi:MAG TPA: hypothetical protein VFJ90_05345, partial [Candidatus Didemnitutus sp.]|nr:hypothetical protein [Candidatus Didemnitutus sp.]
MSDRLNELQRQRALIQEHLAWLDRQIAAEAGRQPTAPSISSSPTVPVAPAASAAPSGDTLVGTISRLSASPFTEAEKIMAQYRAEPNSTKNDVRKGCIIYFALASLVVILTVVAVYFWSKSKH